MSRGKIVAATDESIEQAAHVLKEGGIVGVPTETVYGVAACALNSSAVERIFAAKGRPANNPLIVHLASSDSLEQAVQFPLGQKTSERLELVARFWPGPLTVVLPKLATIPAIVTAGRETVAVRVSRHSVMQKLIESCGFPLAAPSANRSQAVSPTTAEHVLQELGDRIDLILDGGECDWGVESTIIDIRVSPPRLLRPGGVTREQLIEVFGSLSDRAETDRSDGAPLLAPGMMKEHYSPSTPFYLVDRLALPPDALQVARIAFSPLPEEVSSRFAITETLSNSGNLTEVAHRLFAAMRRLDQLGFDQIWCDSCEEKGIGLAIMNRLQRATARFRS